jgi:hypothetical protein
VGGEEGGGGEKVAVVDSSIGGACRPAAGLHCVGAVPAAWGRRPSRRPNQVAGVFRRARR